MLSRAEPAFAHAITALAVLELVSLTVTPPAHACEPSSGVISQLEPFVPNEPLYVRVALPLAAAVVPVVKVIDPPEFVEPVAIAQLGPVPPPLVNAHDGAGPLDVSLANLNSPFT